jgi:FlaA1/EpsC-like NDP-sugar epimerase
MIKVNVINTLKTLELFEKIGTKKYFCVSTDKAANPANLMGATKRIMEDFLQFKPWGFDVSSARFANVAFSDGSLLHGFRERLNKRQPLSAPMDTRRYFITPKEAGELCLVSCLFGDSGDILIPKLSPEKDLMHFDELAVKFLEANGLSPKLMGSEQEARDYLNKNSGENFWPCYFFKSDTTGEKYFEEFFTDNEVVDLDRFSNFGVVQMKQIIQTDQLNQFKNKFDKMQQNKIFNRNAYKELISSIVPELQHIETGKFLNARM